MFSALLKIGHICYGLLVLGVLAFALLFLGTRVDLFGYEVKVVQSGSMEPAILTGSIVVIAPSASYQIGDVITFGQDTRRRVPVTHRVVEKNPGNRTTYVTKGDANEEADNAVVRERDVIGKVLLSVPYVGFAIEFARSPLGFALLVGLPATIIVLDELANIVWEVRKWQHLRRRKRQGPVGYRTPSRQRLPRQQTPIQPSSTQKQPVKRVENSASPVLDLRHYQPKHRSI